MFVAIVAVATLVSALTEKEYQDKFVGFMQAHKKSYDYTVFLQKYATFKTNVDFIEKWNAADNTHTVAMNEFGDLTAAEFGAIYNGYKPKAGKVRGGQPMAEALLTQAMPTTVDWRTKGAVTSIKNQGQCGSCWSFSTTGSVEGQHLLSGQGSLVGLSEQNLMDCSSSYGNDGCDGGLMDDAFQYIIANNGIELESDYPYTAEDGSTCNYDVSDRGACIENYVDVPSGNEAALTSAIATIGPISVAIDASHSSFQFYNGGVYNEPQCSSTQLDHGVLAVGYGVYNSHEYYLVKNSWGTSWGLSGYIMMSRGKHNQCGIATAASYPTISNTNC